VDAPPAPAFPTLAEGRLSTLVVNAKGGSGKTTLATNLAVAFAHAGAVTALVDQDPQGSATAWLKARPAGLLPIDGVEAWRVGEPGVTRSFLLRPALTAQRVVTDTPAAIAPNQLGQWLADADRVLIPVLPSAIDIRAAARFVGALLLDPAQRARKVPVAVVANRVRRGTKVFDALERFLASLRIPFVATLRDTQNYVRCTETGEGLFDPAPGGVRGGRLEDDRDDLLAVLRWIETGTEAR
jgi:chromosome partitioning protein